MADRIFLGHTTKLVTASVTRPGDTTAYAAGDVIGTAVTHMMELSSIARSVGGAGMIVTADVIDSANKATKPVLELWVFSAAPAAQVDNVAFSPTDAEMANLVAVIPLSTTYVGNAGADAAGNVYLPSAVVSRAFKCAASADDLYCCLVVRNAYTPVASEVFTVKVYAMQDY